jgi:hypothetical protein
MFDHLSVTNTADGQKIYIVVDCLLREASTIRCQLTLNATPAICDGLATLKNACSYLRLALPASYSHAVRVQELHFLLDSVCYAWGDREVRVQANVYWDQSHKIRCMHEMAEAKILRQQAGNYHKLPPWLYEFPARMSPYIGIATLQYQTPVRK